MLKKSKFVIISLMVVLFFASCSTQGAKHYNTEKAVYELAAVPRNASKPTEGVYYSLFVRSFADSDGDGVGDFKGLTEKLDYLNDGDDFTTTDLGITGIWLLPIFPSQTYHGYNVDDYYAINPDYGSMKDFEIFLKEADKRGISVILDLTCNHSSVYTDWFIDSKDKDSPYRNWYRWAEEGDPRFNLNQKIWGHNVWNKVKDSYYSGIFESGMPDFNLSNPEVREEFKKIAKFWMDKGVAGFRFDAAGHVFNLVKLPAGEKGQEQAIDWWDEFVSYIRSVNPEAYTVGEVWEPVSTRANFMAAMYSSFHFDLGTKIIDTIRIEEAGKNNLANSMYAAYKSYADSNPEYIDAPFLTNHDQNRISGMLKGDPTKLKLAASLYILTEGIPFLYYGEEIGMMGAKPDEQIRTPMMWNDPGKDKLQTTWIESIYNKKTVPVAKQMKDKASLLQFYKRIIRLKTEHSALYAGRMFPVWTGEAEIISWLMTSDDENLFVLHNVAGEPIQVTLPDEALERLGDSFSLLFSTYLGVEIDNTSITIPPYCSIVLGN